ncbi:MAG TPA: hypothetical protein PK987_00085 [Ferruginibacter sp.]|nr:hypothetical protein [Ferruginibacter sp.]
MRFSNKYLGTEEKVIALQRLTALWAFSESGLGGVMHALQIPFTGLLVGGMAVIMISMIAEISDKNYNQVLKSAIIVLIVKAMVSPHTPFTAYIAVAFQAMIGYLLFSMMSVNFISIFLLSTIAMLESAIQKILILTLFFGESLWKATDKMVAFLVNQLGFTALHGSYWIIGGYLFIYIAGGILIAWLTYKTIINFDNEKLNLNTTAKPEVVDVKTKKIIRKNKFNRLWLFILIMLGLSFILYFFAADSKLGWLQVLKTLSWTFSVILIWYLIIGPLFTNVIKKFLQKKQNTYSTEVLEILSFIPALRQLTTKAWQHAKTYKGLERWSSFVSTLIYNTLTYTEPSLKK